MLPRFLLFLPFLLPLVLSAFTHHDSDCWHRDCVVRMDAGTLCFEPRDSGFVQEKCPEGFLKDLTQVHLTNSAGRSIIYYDDKARMLGAATWFISSARAGPVFVCMTGRRLDNSKRYHTVCRQARGDDDMSLAAAHTDECVSDQKPQYVSDGCFILDRPEGVDSDRRGWCGQPVLAGIFWTLGIIVTIESICLWVDSLAGTVHSWMRRRDWRRLMPSLPTQQPATQHVYINASVLPFSLSHCYLARTLTDLQYNPTLANLRPVRLYVATFLALNTDWVDLDPVVPPSALQL